MPNSAKRPVIWPIPLWQIEGIVSGHLGPGRIRSNAAAPCLSRQVSMYLAKHVGGWSLPKIGRFYNGRHHTTVLHAIAKVEKLREADQTFDTLLDVLTASLVAEGTRRDVDTTVSSAHMELIEAVAERVIHRLKEMPAIDRTRIEAATVAELAVHGSSNVL